MASSIFGSRTIPFNNAIGGISQLKNIASMLKGKDPSSTLQMLARQNPKFAQFLQQNQGKSPEQIAKDYGVDMNLLQKILR